MFEFKCENISYLQVILKNKVTKVMRHLLRHIKKALAII
jgi:hypothetical protein